MAQEHCAGKTNQGGECTSNKECDCACGPCGVAARRDLLTYLPGLVNETLKKAAADAKAEDEKLKQDMKSQVGKGGMGF